MRASILYGVPYDVAAAVAGPLGLLKSYYNPLNNPFSKPVFSLKGVVCWPGGGGGKEHPFQSKLFGQGSKRGQRPRCYLEISSCGRRFSFNPNKTSRPPQTILQWYVLGIWVCWRPGCSRVPGYTRVCPGSGYTQTSCTPAPGISRGRCSALSTLGASRRPLKGPLKAPYQRDPEVFFWPSVFLEAWSTKAKTPHIL